MGMCNTKSKLLVDEAHARWLIEWLCVQISGLKPGSNWQSQTQLREQSDPPTLTFVEVRSHTFGMCMHWARR